MGPAEPLGYREVHWDQYRTCTRSCLVRDFEKAQGEVYFLEPRMKGPAEQPAAPEYPVGGELELVQDDLGLFAEAKQLFFAS